MSIHIDVETAITDYERAFPGKNRQYVSLAYKQRVFGPLWRNCGNQIADFSRMINLVRTKHSNTFGGETVIGRHQAHTHALLRTMNKLAPIMGYHQLSELEIFVDAHVYRKTRIGFVKKLA